MIDATVYRSIRNSTCAIISSPCRIFNTSPDDEKADYTKFKIHGTGFLIANNTVMSCRDVVESIFESENDFIGCMFWTPMPDGYFRAAVCGIGQSLAPSDVIPFMEKRPYFENKNLAVLEVALSDDLIRTHRPVLFGSRNDIHIGYDIAICGYIYGNEMLGSLDDNSTLRFEPLLLQGHIAGLSPHDNLLTNPINLIITDITQGGELSGSPIFNKSGRVIGINTRGLTREVIGDPVKGKSTIEVSLGIGKGIPLMEEEFGDFAREISQTFEKNCLARELSETHR